MYGFAEGFDHSVRAGKSLIDLKPVLEFTDHVSPLSECMASLKVLILPSHRYVFVYYEHCTSADECSPLSARHRCSLRRLIQTMFQNDVLSHRDPRFRVRTMEQIVPAREHPLHA
jgi:hypothetical protein